MRTTEWKSYGWVNENHLRNYLYLTGEIDEETAMPVIDWITFHNATCSKYSPLYLFVDSGGGDSTTGLSICNFIRSSPIPIHTIGTGIVGSAALLIFMSGAHRTMLRSTSVLSHQFSWAIEGKYHDLTADHTELQNVQTRITDVYKAATGLPVRTISKELLPAGNRWLTADEALSYGLCDAVVDKIDMSVLAFDPK